MVLRVKNLGQVGSSWVKVVHVDFQCVKSKSVTNLAEATADPSIDNFDARGNFFGGAGNT